jgi:hypothetical protein
MHRIEYTLSLENYLEMTSSRREKPKYRAAIISALIGFSFIALGYTYLKIWPDTRTIIGGMLQGSGLLATGFAMILAFFAKPKSSRPNITTLRGEYQRFHSDKRAIVFDDMGWRLFWYEGEDVRSWSCVRAIHDQKTLLVLSTETTHYWLPKAALEQDGRLAEIRGLAEAALTNRELLFTVPMRPSAAAYVAAMFLHNWSHHLKTSLLSYAAATLLVYWLLFADWNSTPPSSAWLLVLVPFSFIFCEGLYYLRNYFFADWSKSPQEVEIRSDCVCYRTESIHWIAKYEHLEKLRETPSAFLLYFEPKTFHLIPKKGFSKEQILQFRKLFSSPA